jgi:hypothetical protein
MESQQLERNNEIMVLFEAFFVLHLYYFSRWNGGVLERPGMGMVVPWVLQAHLRVFFFFL